MLRRLRLAPDVSLDEEAVVHHRRAHIFLRRLARPVPEFRIGELFQPVADAPGGQEGGELARSLDYFGELRRKGDLLDFVMRKEAARARQAVIGKLHGLIRKRARVGPP
jgi:hypothetical protein